MQHGAEERRRALVAEIQSRQHVLDDVGHQRQQAAVRVSQHHRQHPGSLRLADGEEMKNSGDVRGAGPACPTPVTP